MQRKQSEEKKQKNKKNGRNLKKERMSSRSPKVIFKKTVKVQEIQTPRQKQKMKVWIEGAFQSARCRLNDTTALVGAGLWILWELAN